LRLLCGVCSQSCPNKSANKTGHRWYLPKQSKKAEFCRARCCCLAHIARHGMQHALKCTDLSNGPHSVEKFSNAFGEEGRILVRRIGRLDVLQPGLVSSCGAVRIPGFQLGPQKKWPLQWTPCSLMESHRAKRADVLKDANNVPTGSSPMAQKPRPIRTTPLPFSPRKGKNEK
jgi:hypothetical protein